MDPYFKTKRKRKLFCFTVIKKSTMTYEIFHLIQLMNTYSTVPRKLKKNKYQVKVLHDINEYIISFLQYNFRSIEKQLHPTRSTKTSFYQCSTRHYAQQMPNDTNAIAEQG